MTALLSGVVVVLVVCHTPKTIINIYECYQVHKYIMSLGTNGSLALDKII